MSVLETEKTFLKTEKSSLKTFKLPNTFNSLYEKIINDIKDDLFINPPVFVYGKKCYQHRTVGFFSNISEGYKYSGQIAKSIKLTTELEFLLNYINKEFQSDFNGILINKYNNGSDYIGKHSDDEKELSKKGVVAITYGATRKFRIRDKETNKIVIDVYRQSQIQSYLWKEIFKKNLLMKYRKN